MQLLNIVHVVLLTISLVATSVTTENRRQELLDNKKVGRRITKRESAVLIDNFPLESMFNTKQKVIYRRVSKQRIRGPLVPKSKYEQSTKYNPPSSKFRSPSPKYGPPKIKYPIKHGRNVVKKYKGKSSSKYRSRSPPRYKKRITKPRQRPSKHPRLTSTYGPPKQMLHHSYPSEPIGFGEPPQDFTRDFEPPSPAHRELPVDSYGAPLKASLNEAYHTGQGASDLTSLYDTQYQNIGQEYQPSWQIESSHQVIDTGYAHSKNHPTYAQPAGNLFNEHTEYNEDVNLDTHSDLIKQGLINDPNLQKKKVPQFLSNKLINKPRNTNTNKETDEILVGGQYAEPPARYVPHFQPSAPMYGNEDFNPVNSFADSEVAASANISPYVNYKNSNLAFSPQNLNDAFSIVD